MVAPVLPKAQPHRFVGTIRRVFGDGRIIIREHRSFRRSRCLSGQSSKIEKSSLPLYAKEKRVDLDRTG